jgi:hypothetical protein
MNGPHANRKELPLLSGLPEEKTMEKTPENPQDPTPKRDKPKTKITPEGRKRIGDAQRGSSRGEVVAQVGVILPTCPTSPQEIVAAWKIAPHDVESHGVLVFRQTQGSDERQLIDRVPITEYSMDNIANQYGPGSYFLKATAGIYEGRAARFVISPEYAAMRGYGKMSDPIRAADVMAARTLQKTAEIGGIDPTELVNALERAVESGLDRRFGQGRPQQGYTPHPPAAFDQMETQFAQVERMYSFMERMETRAMDSVSRRMGIEPKDEVNPNSWAGILQTLLPAGIELASRLMASKANPIPTQAPVTQAQVAPTQENAVKPSQEVPTIVAKMTEQEKKDIIPSLGMLRPFLGALHKMTVPGRSEADIAIELDGYIPDAMAASMMALSNLTDKHGVEALGLLGKPFQTGQWMTILGELKKILANKYSEET